jgi:hypothetical protein
MSFSSLHVIPAKAGIHSFWIPAFAGMINAAWMTNAADLYESRTLFAIRLPTTIVRRECFRLFLRRVCTARILLI